MWRLLKMAWAAVTDPQVRSAIGVARRVKEYYATSYLAGLADSPLLDAFARGPLSLDEIAQCLCQPAGKQLDRDALESWVTLGLSLGLIGGSATGYTLRSRLARRLACPGADAARAFLINLARTHVPLIAGAPGRIGRGEKIPLAAYDAGLIARSSLTLEFAIRPLMDGVIPVRGPVRLLEVGCGSGQYIRHAATRNPDLTALGIDQSPDVVKTTRARLAEWNLSDRADIRCGDVRDLEPGSVFDVITLHNFIYYLPVAGRVALYERLRRYLAKDGVVVTTTWCRGRTPGAAAIDLWFSLTDGCGRLPTRAELGELLGRAGYCAVECRRLLPFEEYYAFVAGVV
jgi:4-hydroxy-2,2'-bipyrrole-5-carbaldehyde O-methyltransferase